MKFVLHLLARFAPIGRHRAIFYKMMGVRIMGDVSISGNVWIDEYAPKRISIENDVYIAPGVIIVAHQGPGKFLRESEYPFCEKEVLIKEGSWIGAGAIILPGVTIGKFCVVAAGSVVLKDVPNNTLVAGVPARIKKTISKSVGETAEVSDRSSGLHV